MDKLFLIIALAITVEALVEYIKTIYEWFAKGEFKTAVLQLSAITIAVLLCFAVNANLFAALDMKFVYPWIGVALTGIIASRGANFVSDFIGKLQHK